MIYFVTKQSCLAFAVIMFFSDSSVSIIGNSTISTINRWLVDFVLL